MTARTIVRLTSVTLSLGLILAFAITAASADLPGCRNCIDASDIATGAVGTAEIKNGAVGKADLAASATTAAGWVLLDQLASTDAVAPAVDELDRFKVKSPGPGVLFVQVTGKFYVETEGSSTLPGHRLALCTTPTAVNGSSCGASDSQEEGLFYGDGVDAGPHPSPYFTLSRVIKVSKAGTTTFYLNGQIPVMGEVLSLLGPVRATAMFVPRALSVTL